MAMEAVKMNTNMEQELEKSGVMMINIANDLTITSNEDYERGNYILKDIKARIKQVKDYWKAPKAAAQDAHKTLVVREAQMLKPLETAESVIKKAMLAYMTEIQRKQREAEEAARRQREEEEHRLEALAAEAEKNGDIGGAEFMREMAQTVETPEVISEAAPVAQGISVRTSWKARVIDKKLVPAYFNGYELREINMTVLNSLAKWSGGEAKIPGVEFYQDSTLVSRS